MLRRKEKRKGPRNYLEDNQIGIEKTNRKMKNTGSFFFFLEKHLHIYIYKI